MIFINFFLFLEISLTGFRNNYCDGTADMALRHSSFVYPKDQEETLSFYLIGGAEAIPHYFPYVVSIQVHRFDSYSFFCAGSLIANRWVLTAAHCLYKTNYTNLYFGHHNLSASESSQIEMVSYQFVIHEDWNDSLFLNDIGLIYLPEDIALTDQIQTIKIASGNDSYANLTAFSMGWGTTSLGKRSDVLRYLDVKILENSVCQGYRLYTDTVKSSHLCTSGEGMVGPCKGDSGGPLVYKHKQIGISSFGYTACYSEKPSVYTRLTNYTQWLKNKTNIDFDSADGNANGSSKFDGKNLSFAVLFMVSGVVLLM